MTLYQIPTSRVDWSKNMAPRGRGYFALYGYNDKLRETFSSESVKPIFK